MSGALLQLVASGAMNFHYPIERTSDILKCNYITNIDNEIERWCDIILVEKILIPKRYINENMYLELLVGGRLIWKLPISLLYKLKKKEIGNKVLINLDNNLLFNKKNGNNVNGIILIALQYNTLKIKLTSKSNFEYSIYYKNIFCETNNRRLLAQNGIEQYINQIDSISYPREDNAYNGNLVSSGLFFETNNELNDFKMLINNHELINYDEFIIDDYCKLLYKKKNWSKKHLKELNKIKLPKDILNIIYNYLYRDNEYMYWIPFDSESDWSNLPLNNSLNLSRLENIKIYTNVNSGKEIYGIIHYLQHNILRIQSGMGGIVFQ